MLEIHVAFSRRNLEFNLNCTLPCMTTGIFGPSGAGKSTLLYLIAGLLQPDSGRVVLNRQVLFDSERSISLPTHQRSIAMVFQDSRLFPHLSAKGNLVYGLGRTPREDRHHSLRQTIEMLDLWPLLKRRVSSLSGGERQRIALGRAILSNPSLLLLDEPLASLDRAARQEILPYLRELQQQTELPMLIVSHDLSEILSLTDQLLLLREGKTIGWGAYDDLRRDDRLNRYLSGPATILPMEHSSAA